MNVRPISTLFIDLDETLLHSQGSIFRLLFLKHALRLLSPHTQSFWKSLKLIHQIRYLDYNANSSRLNIDLASELFGKHLSLNDTQARSMFSEISYKIFDAIENYATPVQGAKDFIEWAKPKFTLVLATNPIWPESVTRLRLKWSGIAEENFQFITHAENSTTCKPDRRYYQSLLDRFKLAPENALMIGDSFSKDGPAADVGISVVILEPTQNKLFQVRPSIWRGSFQAIQNHWKENFNHA